MRTGRRDNFNNPYGRRCAKDAAPNSPGVFFKAVARKQPVKNVLSKTEHRKGVAGFQQGADRVPSDALLHQTGPVCIPAAPGRRPGGKRAAC